MRTEVLPWDGVSDRERESTVERAHELICGGSLVAYPTETVYGLAAAGTDAAAVAGVFAAKGRPADRPLLLAVYDLDAAADLVVDIPRVARLLEGAFWPGPLSLVLDAAEAVPRAVTAGTGTVGLRCPAHPAARALVRVTGPITSPSANISGRPSPRSAADVLENLEGRIAAVIDGGPSPGGRESTVIDVRGGPKILRWGAVSPGEIRDVLGASIEIEDGNPPPRDTVLFVCTGNTCRSPAAAAVFRHRLRNAGLRVASAGVAAPAGTPASPGSVEVAGERGYDLGGHRSRGLEEVCWSRVALVVGMAGHHGDAVKRHLTGLDLDSPPRVVTLGELAGGDDLKDPFGGPPEEYRAMMDEIEEYAPIAAPIIIDLGTKGGRS